WPVAAAEITGAANRARIDETAGHAAAVVTVERGALDIDAAVDAGDGAGVFDLAAARQDDAEASALDRAVRRVGDERAVILAGLVCIGIHRHAVAGPLIDRPACPACGMPGYLRPDIVWFG